MGIISENMVQKGAHMGTISENMLQNGAHGDYWENKVQKGAHRLLGRIWYKRRHIDYWGEYGTKGGIWTIGENMVQKGAYGLFGRI